MRILFLDAYFEPEQIAFTHLENDLLKGIVEAGHEVEIVCPTPTRGVSSEVIQEYKKRKREDIYDGHVHVIRFWAPQEGKNPFIRALRYFWCNLRSFQIGKSIDQIDIVFANSTPPTQGWIAGKIAKMRKVPFIYSLQDIFPDSLVATGLTHQGSLLWKIGRKIECSTYKLCTQIVVISESMKDNLLQKGVPEKLIHVVFNWIDLDSVNPVSRVDNILFDEFNISRESFIVLYAGNMGESQGAEIVLDVAEKLQDELDIQFVIFGGGSGYASAENKAKKLSNVFIHPLLPQKMVSEVYSMGDVALIVCKKGVGRIGMPSKTWSIMACNKPIIASYDLGSDLDRILTTNRLGICVQPNDVNAVTSAILELKTINNQNNMGRSYVLRHASRYICVNEYIMIFDDAIKSY